MKINACDFCLGGITGLGGKPLLVIATHRVGWKGGLTVHACAQHKDAHSVGLPLLMANEVVIRRVQKRARAGAVILNPPTGKGWRASELAVTIGGAKADMAEPFWGVE